MSLREIVLVTENGDSVPVSEIHSYAVGHHRAFPPQTENSSTQWQRSEELIKNASPNAHEMLLNGKAPLPGQIMTFKTLANTFKRLVEHGTKGFYEGPVAEAIVELIASKGGVMTVEDLAEHRSTFVEPIKYTYKEELTVYEV
jgi:gamma-glutamyltranspeptidase/glutathione hydrolase